MWSHSSTRNAATRNATAATATTTSATTATTSATAMATSATTNQKQRVKLRRQSCQLIGNGELPLFNSINANPEAVMTAAAASAAEVILAEFEMQDTMVLYEGTIGTM
jgi:hypothetical protein